MCLQYMNQISFLSQVKHFKLQLFPNAFLYATAKETHIFTLSFTSLKVVPGRFGPESFRPLRRFHPGSFRPGSFRPKLVGRFGLSPPGLDRIG